MIERQVAHLVRLIEDLMDVGRITRGRLQLRREPLALAQVLDQVAESIRPQLELTGQTFAYTLPPEPVYVNADRVRLTQVLLNLLDNACKYTGEGGAVHLTAERDADEVEIRVSDTGIGIPQEELGGVFQMFARVGASAQHAQGGLGVGLALARGLVEMHGGRIEAHSEGLGRGATLVVRLPVLSQPPPALEPDQGDHSPQAGPLRILVADDNRDVVDSLSLLLELTGYRVYRAYDGLQAVEAAERCRPDLVLLDLGMPNLDGYEACRRIRRQPWGRDLPIVALTGWGQEEHLVRSKAAGFTNHLVKPVDHGDLLRLLAEQQPARP
jgi:CheY-like chemotaxis protein